MRLILWLWWCWEPEMSSKMANGHSLGFYPKLEVIKERQKVKIFYVRNLEYDVMKHCSCFSSTLCGFFHIKKWKTRFQSKMAWPPATYDVISHNHSTRFSPNFHPLVCPRVNVKFLLLPALLQMQIPSPFVFDPNYYFSCTCPPILRERTEN